MSETHPTRVPTKEELRWANIKSYFTWPVNERPTRVVSLVPSLTDSLIQLGLGNTLVGITTYCPEPLGQLTQKVGGPATLDLERIVNLSPDLIIGGLEENSPKELLKLGAAGFPLWIVFPRTVAETIAILYQIAEGFRSKQAFQQVRSLEVSLDYLRSSAEAGSSKVRYFCPVWQERLDGNDLWMVFDRRTYAADLLSIFGAENCFGQRETFADPEAEHLSELDLSNGDTRYFKITVDEVRAANPQLVLLPSEPYAFNESHKSYLKQVLKGVVAIEEDNIHLIDGKLIFWYGTRLAQALRELPSFFSKCCRGFY